MTIRQENDLQEIANDLYYLFWQEIGLEADEKKPRFKQRLKSYLYRWFEIAEFKADLEGKNLDHFCDFLKAIYQLVLQRVEALKLE